MFQEVIRGDGYADYTYESTAEVMLRVNDYWLKGV